MTQTTSNEGGKMNGAIGIFLTFEGGEGGGKSTQLLRLAQDLQCFGVVRVIREPGGTKIGEAVRAILLDPEHTTMSDNAELLLFGAARAQIVNEVIRPAITAGEIVICDRFFDSTTAYQAFARGIDRSYVDSVREIATQGLDPDMTICLDIDVETGICRATKEGADRLEAEGFRFHQKVRDGFLTIAREEPDRFKIVDASGTLEEVYTAIHNLVWPLLAARLRRK